MLQSSNTLQVVFLLQLLLAPCMISLFIVLSDFGLILFHFDSNMGTSALCTLPANTEVLWWFLIMISELLELLCVHYKISLYGEGNWIFIIQSQRF